jgi:hypothetical protein
MLSALGKPRKITCKLVTFSDFTIMIDRKITAAKFVRFLDTDLSGQPQSSHIRKE